MLWQQLKCSSRSTATKSLCGCSISPKVRYLFSACSLSPSENEHLFYTWKSLSSTDSATRSGSRKKATEMFEEQGLIDQMSWSRGLHQQTYFLSLVLQTCSGNRSNTEENCITSGCIGYRTHQNPGGSCLKRTTLTVPNPGPPPKAYVYLWISKWIFWKKDKFVVYNTH